ncbi:MAG: 16S rRNA (cytidine(1402)-2'-O)-methyltransferase [Deltaproteobacteria bacterium]|nr:16S rRNA (cytidine(1402)-2'-O)-methyltransferase [Deltaproteobacteria bacterium]
MKNAHRPGTLYIVATPIGNLEDISARALHTLETVSLIACEDTRHSRKLLSRFQISTPLTSYYREKEQYKAGILINKLQEGQDIALISDAGTPGISDPGAILVRQARAAGIAVIPIPGPSALAAALSAAGLEENGFFFGGFPPAKKGLRCKLFQGLAALPFPLVFYESPHRIKSCLQDCLSTFGERQALLFRELTKIHEQCLDGPLSQLLEQVKNGVRGELVLIIQADINAPADKPDNLDHLLAWYRQQPGMKLKKAVQLIAADLDLPRTQVYRAALETWHRDDQESDSDESS